jgi:4-hydroxybenzoate polyprenyltransferase
MLVGLKIVVDVFVYRLRKLEMFNMGAAVLIALALALPWAEFAYRALFAFFLNALAYLNNDYFDVELDLESADKDATKTRFLADHMKEALWAQWVLIAILVVIIAASRDLGLLVPLVMGGGVCIWYSVQLKHKPLLDLLAMVIFGAGMPLCGSPLNQWLGIALALQLGLFSGVFETIQVTRDADEDAAEGVRTTGVVLGKTRAVWLARSLMLVSTAYAVLVIHPVAAAVMATALVIPFNKKRVEKYWTIVKFIYGIAFLLMCGFIYFDGRSSGLLGAITRVAN